MKNMKKTLVSIICALGLTITASPAISYDLHSDVPVKKIRVTNSHIWNEDLGTELSYTTIERTLEDGTMIIDEDSNGDGAIDHRTTKKKQGPWTEISEYDYNLDGKPDVIEKATHLIGGSKIEYDTDGDGETDMIISNMLISRGNVTSIDYDADGKADCIISTRVSDNVIIEEEDYNADGKPEYIKTTRNLDGVKKTEHDFEGDGSIEEIVTEQISPDGTKITERYNPDTQRTWYRETEKMVTPNVKMTQIDWGADGVDTTRIERTLDDGTEITEIIRESDGKTVYNKTKTVTEINL